MFKFWLFDLLARIRLLGEFGLDNFDKSILGEFGGLDTEILAHLFLHIKGDGLTHPNL